MANESGNNDVAFVYMGGDQEVPTDVTHVRVHKSVKIIPCGAFFSLDNCRKLVSIEMHDGVEIIEGYAFSSCHLLQAVKNMTGVRVIEEEAFVYCNSLADVEFGDKLVTIGPRAFDCCYSLWNIKLPRVRNIQIAAFYECVYLTDVELSENIETIELSAFRLCQRLRRIVIPLRDNIFPTRNGNVVNVFYGCEELSQVDLVGGIHETIASLHLESWRNDMNDEIDRINQFLSTFSAEYKTMVIQDWIEEVLERMEFFKSEHCTLLKEAMTLLELALWKAKLDGIDEIEEGEIVEQPAKKVKTHGLKDETDERQEKRITSGASIVIKNVLPFLKLE